MKRYLSSSIFVLSVFTVIGFLIHISTRSSAHASFEIDLAISPLMQLTDSLRNVSLSLDTKIMELHAIDSTLGTHLNISAESAELRQAAMPMPAPSEEYFGAAHPDAFHLTDRIRLQQQHIDSITAALDLRRSIIAHLPTLTPTKGTHSSNFGPRFHPIDSVWKNHSGIDFAAPTGAAIYAAGDGVVKISGVVGGYGNLVEVDHGFGYRTRYAHCSELVARLGDTVKRGDLIALVGSTGKSTGPHLHFEMIVDDAKVDPLHVIRDPILPSMVRASEPKVAAILAKKRKAEEAKLLTSTETHKDHEHAHTHIASN